MQKPRDGRKYFRWVRYGVEYWTPMTDGMTPSMMKWIYSTSAKGSYDGVLPGFRFFKPIGS